MIQVCKNKSNKCVLITRRNDSRTTFITIKNNQRAVVVLSNKVFDKQYRPIEHSPLAAIETWMESTIPMTVSVRKEIQMVIAIFRNKIVAQANSGDELDVNDKAILIDGMESLEGMTMKQLVKLYNVTLAKDDRVKVIPGAEGDINVAAQITLDALESYEIPEKPVKAKTGGRISAKTYTVNKFPAEGEKMPEQAVGILTCIDSVGGQTSRADLLEKLPDFITTKQTAAAIVAFYQKRLVEGGFITIS